MRKVNFKNLEWYILEINEENVKLLCVNVLDEKHIKKYIDDERYRYEDRVRYDLDFYNSTISWENSYIKNIVLENFKNDMGIDCEVDLLTREERNNLIYQIRNCNKWYWTKTMFDNHRFFAGTASGFSSPLRLDACLGIRPVLYTKTSNLNLTTKEIKDYIFYNEDEDLKNSKKEELSSGITKIGTIDEIIKWLRNKREKNNGKN